MSHEKKIHEKEELVCGNITVDVALETSVVAYKAAIAEIGATICEVAQRTNSRIDQVAGDLKTYSDNADQAILDVVAALGSKVDALVANPNSASKSPEQILAEAHADAQAVVAAALAISPQAAQELQILLTLVQEAPELRNIAGIIARLADVERRVTAIEAAALTEEDVDCRAISVAVHLTDRLTDALKNFRLDVMNCAFPVPAGQ